MSPSMWPEGSLTAVCGMLGERLNVSVPTWPPDQLNQGLGMTWATARSDAPVIPQAVESESPRPGLL